VLHLLHYKDQLIHAVLDSNHHNIDSFPFLHDNNMYELKGMQEKAGGVNSMKACMTNDEKYRSLLDVCDTDIIYEGV
jgi:hypothetical protein